MSLPFRRAIARLVPSVCGSLPLREIGPHVSWVILSYIMPWRSSFPCHRMCCGPDTLPWYASPQRPGSAGEQSTFWFYHSARERREQTVTAQLGTTGQPGHITLDTYASTQQAGQALEGYFSAGSPQGLFAPPETSPQAQQELLMALDMHLTPQQRQQGEGTAGDGSISLEELTQTLQGLARGKSPGFDGLPYEFYLRFWDQLGPELTAVLSEAFQAGAAALPADMTEGPVTLLYKGKGSDRAQPASYRPITLLRTTSSQPVSSPADWGRCSTMWWTAHRLASCRNGG